MNGGNEQDTEPKPIPSTGGDEQITEPDPVPPAGDAKQDIEPESTTPAVTPEQSAFSRFSNKVKDLKELVTGLLIMAGLLITAFQYFAPASDLKKLECALRSQGVLATVRDSRIMNNREKTSTEEQERLLNDLLIIIQDDLGDTQDIVRLKNRLRTQIEPRVERLRDQVAELEKVSAELNANVEQLVRRVEQKECPI